VTTAITKDGGSLTLAALLRDGAAETKVETSVPEVGSLPVLGLYFRNGTKRSRLEVDDLFVFVTPQIVEVDETP
jgi:Flp pilus assembly secretin CpaC